MGMQSGLVFVGGGGGGRGAHSWMLAVVARLLVAEVAAVAGARGWWRLVAELAVGSAGVGGNGGNGGKLSGLLFLVAVGGKVRAQLQMQASCVCVSRQKY
jgi:hypothetical protein